MGVLYARGDATSWAEDLFIDWNCLECGEAIEFPCVYWQAARLLMFHPACAARLGPHLIADSREADLAGSAEPRWRRRAIVAVRHRLRVEEGSAA